MRKPIQKLLSIPGRWFATKETASARRADLDWLRIFAFGLKAKASTPYLLKRVGYMLARLVMIPFAMEVLI